jgi:hypothetical protein
MPHPLIVEHLTTDDDPNFWDAATTRLLADAAALAAGGRKAVFAQIGCCHHWISPHHPIRWAADGGFAWPFGYDKTTTGWSYRAAPEFTWSELLHWNGEAWEGGRSSKRSLIFRIAMPARTARHLQAAIHTIWLPHAPHTREKVVRLYGFRKRSGNWILRASEELRKRRQTS